MPSIFACFHKWMGRRINFCLDGTIFEYGIVITAAWNVDTLVYKSGTVSDNDV